MVVVPRVARHVGMATIGQVEPLNQVEVGEEVKRAEDGRTADREPAACGCVDQVVRREMTALLGHESRNGAPGLGHADAGSVERLDERRGGRGAAGGLVRHGSTIAEINA